MNVVNTGQVWVGRFRSFVSLVGGLSAGARGLDLQGLIVVSDVIFFLTRMVRRRWCGEAGIHADGGMEDVQVGRFAPAVGSRSLV